MMRRRPLKEKSKQKKSTGTALWKVIGTIKQLAFIRTISELVASMKPRSKHDEKKTTGRKEATEEKLCAEHYANSEEEQRHLSNL